MTAALPPHELSAHVGVYDAQAHAFVTDVTLDPGADVVLGSASDCTVPLPPSLGIERVHLISAGRQLLFSTVHRVNMMADGTDDHVVGTPDQLHATGLRSPVTLRWHRLNITLRQGLSVFIKYVPR